MFQIYLVGDSHKIDNVIPEWQSRRHWKFLPLALVRNDIVYSPSARRQCHSLLEQEEEISNACSTATQERPNPVLAFLGNYDLRKLLLLPEIKYFSN